MQKKQNDWHWQWSAYEDDSLFLFQEWIAPHTLETFRDKSVVECGCGGGQHTSFVAPYAKSIVAIDLNTADLAREKNREHSHIEFVEGDLASVSVREPADVVFCIGVIHHTDDPDKTFENIKSFVKPGGLLMIWCYAKEGNFLNWAVLEPLKIWFLLKLPKSILNFMAFILTAAIYLPVYTIYYLPITKLPYYQYFGNWRRLSFRRNRLNVFDKLNAPTTHFITKDRVLGWFNREEFTDVEIAHYKGVSWRVSGVKR